MTGHCVGTILLVVYYRGRLVQLGSAISPRS